MSPQYQDEWENQQEAAASDTPPIYGDIPNMRPADSLPIFNPGITLLMKVVIYRSVHIKIGTNI